MQLLILVLLCPFLESSRLDRRYYQIEEDPLRYKTFIFIDENGNTQLQDLTVYPELQAATFRWGTPMKNVTLHLYNGANRKKAEVLQLRSFDDLRRSRVYDPGKANYFIIHGYLNNVNSDFSQLVKNAILVKGDFNVFVVDWSVYTYSLYVVTRTHVATVGDELGAYIEQMKKVFALDYDMFRLIGFSLGAHVAGAAGAITRGQVKYIVGLDPAGVLFSLSDLKGRLDESDAKLVHVLHTTSVLGFRSALGHVDFYFNDAYVQPSCGLDVVWICSHGRSFEYYAESVTTKGFEAKLCVENGRSGGNSTTAIMGTLELDEKAHGDYCLTTNGRAPFRKS